MNSLQSSIKDSTSQQSETHVELIKKYLQKIHPLTVRFQVDWFLASQLTEQYVIDLIKYGLVEDGKNARLVLGKPSQCHDNAAKLLSTNPKWTRYFGLAISEDGIWRVHSWLKNTKGRIIETTETRTHYFGLPHKNF